MTTLSVIATVLNEGDNIHHLMQSLTRQSQRPDEVVIVDGGSTDQTVALIESYQGRLPVRVIVQPGCNISEGRNRAIDAAQGQIIAVTDAGVRLVDSWLEHLVRPLLDQPDCQVSGGFFQADPHNAFEVAMGATVLPLREEIDPETFLPSSRSIAFRKSAWAVVGGYPEWLDYCEDLIFDLRLKARFHPFAFAPDALVHFRPRGSFRAFYKQYYLYARGDGKADLWRKRHAIRYITYLLLVPGVFLLGLLHPLLWGLYLPGAAAYLAQPYRRFSQVAKLAPALSLKDRLYALALIPLIRVVGDVAKMAGYPVGWRWRLKHHPPDWRL
jgi:glycosyltransferase involved in cell wall biosynthesis